jgi:surface polysaccharide O-acyltransferase-like enzyme
MTDARVHRPTRELSADLYRVLAVVIVVIGHWLLAAVTFQGGRFGYDEVLAEMPWTQWLTWFFQVVPVFFLVAGYANAASCTRWRVQARGEQRDWLRHRVAGVLGPTSAYVVTLLAVVVGLGWVGLNASQLAIPMWVVALHLWFLPVYLAVVGLTPLAVAAQRRWGLKVPATLAAAVAVVDVVTLVGHVPMLGAVNYALCWGAIYQVGVAWFGGALRGRRPVVLALGAGCLLGIVIGLGLYPISMIGVTGQSIQNTSPPTVALLALAAVQAGLLVAAAPAVTAWLRRATWRHLLAIANEHALALYLWHMVPVVVVALACYPTGLLPQPALGSGGWWSWRLAWVSILVAVTAAEFALLWCGRSLFARPTPMLAVRLPIRWSEPLLFVGVVMAAATLWRFASHGLAPGGHLLVGSALLYFAGVLVVSVNPVGRARSPLGSKGAGIQDRSAQAVDVAPKTPGGAARTIGLGFEDLGLLRSGGPTTSVEDTPQRSATGAGNGHGGPHEPTD